jgi:hypothetical protein
MTTKKIENARIEVDVPINYNSITLRKFIAYMNAKSDIDQCIAITGLSRKQVEGFMYNTIYTINDMFQDALMTGTPKHEHTFFINQMHLGFIPDLNSLTFREYVDLDVLAGQIWKGEEVNYKELPRLLAILFRPVEMKVKNKYTIKPYVTDEIDTYIDNIYDMTMDRVNGSLVFFSTIEKELLLNSQVSSLQSLKKMMTEITQLRAD